MEYLQYATKLANELEPFGIVLNLIINGIPSILREASGKEPLKVVLNLIINGIPSIQKTKIDKGSVDTKVLNLIINGIPSIHYGMLLLQKKKI